MIQFFRPLRPCGTHLKSRGKSGAKKKKKEGARVSIGDSTQVNDALSGEADTVLQLNKSLHDRSGANPYAKVQPRDFRQAKTQKLMLEAIGAANYDKVDDPSQLELKIAEVIKAQKTTWKTVDEAKLRYLIKRQIIIEINLIEERK